MVEVGAAVAVAETHRSRPVGLKVPKYREVTHFQGLTDSSGHRDMAGAVTEMTAWVRRGFDDLMDTRVGVIT
jgi:hypothetical protein